MAQPSSRVTLVQAPTHVGSTHVGSTHVGPTLVGSTLIRRVRLVHTAGPARHDRLVDISCAAAGSRTSPRPSRPRPATGSWTRRAAGPSRASGTATSTCSSGPRRSCASTSPGRAARRRSSGAVAEHVHTLPSHTAAPSSASATGPRPGDGPDGRRARRRQRRQAGRPRQRRRAQRVTGGHHLHDAPEVRALTRGEVGRRDPPAAVGSAQHHRHRRRGPPQPLRRPRRIYPSPQGRPPWCDAHRHHRHTDLVRRQKHS